MGEQSFTSIADGENIKVGDTVSFPVPRRRWWQFWRPKFKAHRVIGVSTNIIKIEE